MAFAKYLLPALVVAGIVSAQGSCPDTDEDGVYSIQNQGDADALQNCPIFDGTISISDRTTGTITLNGVRSISQNLTCTNATNLENLSSDQLGSIGGTFRLASLTDLTNLQMDSLDDVQRLNFEALPNLQSLNFGRGLRSAEGVRIINTGLQNLNGIDLDEVAAFDVTDNRELTELNVNNLSRVTSYLTIASNSDGLEIEFPNLESAANMTFRAIKSVQVPSLVNVTGSFGVYESFITEFSAANLTRTGEALVFVNNSMVTNISLPALKGVGGTFQIGNNSELGTIDGFTKLELVGAALDFAGSFENVSLPALKKVTGDFNMQSTGELDCAFFDERRKQYGSGKYTCEGELEQAKDKDGQSSSGNSPNGPKKNGAAIVSATSNTAAIGVFGALAALFMI